MFYLRPKSKKIIICILLGFLSMLIILGLALLLWKKPKENMPIVATESDVPFDSAIETETSEQISEEESVLSDVTGADVKNILQNWKEKDNLAIVVCTPDIILHQQRYGTENLIFLTTANGISKTITSDFETSYPILGTNYGTVLSGMVLCEGEFQSYYSMGGLTEETNLWAEETLPQISESDEFLQYEIKDVDETIIGILFIPAQITEQIGE